MTIKNIFSRKNINNFLSSNKFLYLIIALFVVQALWIALSFKFPLIFDERTHYEIIAFYSYQYLPFITSQPVSLDSVGSLASGGSGIYHYLMSFPYRFFSLFTASETTKIILLRFINIVFFSVGIFVLSKALKKSDISQKYINIALFIFVFLPITPLLGAHISYDNFLFLITSIFLFAGVSVIRSKNIVNNSLFWFLSFGLLGLSTKLSFAPMFFVCSIFLLFNKLRRYPVSKTGLYLFLKRSKKDFVKLNKRSVIFASSLSIISLLYIAPIYAGNYFKYHNFMPSCSQVIGTQRCDANRFAERAQKASKERNQHKADYINFSVDWYQRMTNFGQSGVKLGNEGAKWFNPPLLLGLFIANGFVIGIGALLYSWRSLKKSASWYLLFFSALATIGSIYLVNLQVYERYHQPFTSNPRYLITAVPVFLVMFVVSFAFALRAFYKIKILGLILVAFVLITQGGGVSTHIINSQEYWYWQKPIIIKVNQNTKQVIEAILIKD